MIDFKKVLLAGVLAVAVPAAAVFAGSAPQKGEALVSDAAPAEAAVVVFGQTLRPGDIRLTQFSAWPVYEWAGLKGYVAEVLPDAQSMTKSPEALCDHIVALYDRTAVALEVAEDKVIVAAMDIWPADSQYQVVDRLASSDPAAVEELVQKLPAFRTDILRLKEKNVRFLTLAFLRDAAVKNCPDHAQKKGYPVLIVPPEDAPDSAE